MDDSNKKLNQQFDKLKHQFGTSHVEQDSVKEGILKKPEQKLSFQHQKAIDEILCAVAVCPMDVELKMIVRMKVWGKNPKIFAPMSYQDIAVDLKCKIKDVIRWEQDALYNIEVFLKKHDNRSILEKFIADKSLKDLIPGDREHHDKKRIVV